MRLKMGALGRPLIGADPGFGLLVAGFVNFAMTVWRDRRVFVDRLGNQFDAIPQAASAGAKEISLRVLGAFLSTDFTEEFNHQRNQDGAQACRAQCLQLHGHLRRLICAAYCHHLATD